MFAQSLEYNIGNCLNIITTVLHSAMHEHKTKAPLPHCRAPRRIQLTGSPSDSSIGPSWLIQGVSSPPSPTLWFNRPGALDLTEDERHALMALTPPPHPHPTSDDSTTAAAAVAVAAAATRSQAAAAVPPRSSGGRYSALQQYGGVLPPGPAIAQPPSSPGSAAIDSGGLRPHDSGTFPSYDGARALIFHKHAAAFATDMHLLMMAAVRGRAAAGEGAAGSSVQPGEGPSEETPSWPWLPLPDTTVGPLGGHTDGREPDIGGFDSGSTGMGASDVSSLLLSPEEREAADVVEVAPELLAFLLEQKMWACFELAVRREGRSRRLPPGDARHHLASVHPAVLRLPALSSSNPIINHPSSADTKADQSRQLLLLQLTCTGTLAPRLPSDEGHQPPGPPTYGTAGK